MVEFAELGYGSLDDSDETGNENNDEKKNSNTPSDDNCSCSKTFASCDGVTTEELIFVLFYPSEDKLKQKAIADRMTIGLSSIYILNLQFFIYIFLRN